MRTNKLIKAKKTFILLVSLIFVFSFTGPFSSAYANQLNNANKSFPENENLASTQISERFAAINSTYNVGEPFSASDADFVSKYGVSPNEPSARGSHFFDVTGSGYGTTIRFYGTIYHNGTFNYTWGGDINAYKYSGTLPQQLALEIECTSYGAIGSGGIGIIYHQTIGNVSGSNPPTWSYSGFRNYSGTTISYSLSAYCTVTTASGSFVL